MGFVTPTLQGSSTYPGQEYLDATDIAAVVVGLLQTGIVTPTTGIVTLHSAGSTCGIDVAACTILYGGVEYSYAGTSNYVSSIYGTPTSHDRRDLVVLTGASPPVLSVVQGTPCGVANWTQASGVSAPVKPAIPSGSVAIAELYYVGGATSLATGCITDKSVPVAPAAPPTAADTSIVVTTTGGATTIATGTLDVIATDHPPAASVPMNSHKFTGLANGSASGDSAAYGQLLTGWVSDATTWTYGTYAASGGTETLTFTVPGNLTGTYSKGTRVQFTVSSTVYYGVVIASSYSSPNTTVTIIGNTLPGTSGTISANSYSYMGNPQGYPQSFTYTPTIGGTPNLGSTGTITGRFIVDVGGRCNAWADVTWAGTGQSAGSGFYSISCPVNQGASNLTDLGSGFIYSGITDLPQYAVIATTASSSTVYLYFSSGPTGNGTYGNIVASNGPSTANFWTTNAAIHLHLDYFI